MTEKRKEQKRQWYLKNKEKMKEYRKKNREKISLYNKEYQQKNKERLKEQREMDKEKLKEYRIKNKEKMKEYRKKNREKHREYEKIYKKEKREKDLNFKLSCNLRSRINTVVTKKSGHTMDLLGCDIDFFLQYLESKFQPGMSWDNYGIYGWHIDHIRPCSSFNLLLEEEQKACFHYTNLQPLWAEDNLRKGDKWEEQFISPLLSF